jgi:hypothetical protein
MAFAGCSRTVDPSGARRSRWILRVVAHFNSSHVRAHVTEDRPHNPGSKFASQPTIIVAREIPGSISITTQAASRQQIAHHDQGYCQFRKEAQQDSRLVPSLRLVLLPTISCRTKRYLESVGNDRRCLATKGPYDNEAFDTARSTTRSQRSEDRYGISIIHC